MVKASIVNRIGQVACLKASAIGKRASFLLSLAAVNSGDSLTPRRIAIPTARRTRLNRNGILHPQTAKLSPDARETIAKIPIESTTPPALPTFANEASQVPHPLAAHS